MAAINVNSQSKRSTIAFPVPPQLSDMAPTQNALREMTPVNYHEPEVTQVTPTHEEFLNEDPIPRSPQDENDSYWLSPDFDFLQQTNSSLS